MKNIEVTEGMIQAAIDVLETDGVSRSTMASAIGAALAVAPEQEQAVAWAGRAVAMDKARELVDAMSTAPVKANGYAVDGWRAPTLDERTDAILRLAAFLSGGEQE